MAISRVAAGSAQSNTASISAPNLGDVIVVFSHRDGSTTAPTLASGYENIASGGANTNSARIAWKFSDGTETSIGTWTNATSVSYAIYRGCDQSFPIGDFVVGGAASTSIAYNGLTMKVTDGSSWVVGFAGHRTATDVGQAPTGMGVRSSATDVVVNDTNAGVSSWSTQSVTVNANSGWRSYVVEIVADANVIVDQLVGHVASQTNGNFETGDNFKIRTLNATRAGNCLVLCLSHAHSVGRTLTITDNQGSTWPAASISRVNNAGDLKANIFVLPNVAAGITWINLDFDTTIEGVVYSITELWGIAQSSPVDVTSSGQPNTPDVAAGSLTTTQANDVVISWFTPGGWGTPYAGTVSMGIRAMQGFRLLHADVGDGRNAGGGLSLCMAAQIGVKASAGSINPTMYVLTSVTESMNTLAVALKTDATKGSQATGIRVVGIQKTRMNNGTLVRKNFPSWGNLLILTTSQTPSQCTINDVKDATNAGTLWTKLNDAGYPQLAYLPNAVTGSSLVAQITNTTNFLHATFYDIAGANDSPFDTTAFTSGGTIVGPADVPNAPDITPSTANGLVIGILNFFTGPPDNCDLPSGVQYDCCIHDGMTDLSTMDTGDGYAHFNNPDTATQNWRWHETAVTTTGWFVRAVAFKGAVSAAVAGIKAFARKNPGRGPAPAFRFAPFVQGIASAAGTAFNQSVDGTITSAGALLKLTSTAKAGSVAIAGALLKLTSTARAGTVTSAGTLLKQAQKILAGTVTSSGALTSFKVALKALTGTITSSGALIKQTNKVLGGTVTSAGSLVRQSLKLLAGTVTSSGALIKRTSKAFTGSIASSGTLATIRVFLRSVAGTITSSGTLARLPMKALGGTVASAGSLVRRTSKGLAGSVAIAGALTKRTTLAVGRLIGVITSAGALLTADGSIKGFLVGVVRLVAALTGRPRTTSGLDGQASVSPTLEGSPKVEPED